MSSLLFIYFRWQGRYFWGVSYQEINLCSFTPCQRPDGKTPDSLSVVLSSSEKQEVKDVLLPLCDGQLTYASGAGYKVLCVIQGLVDMYVLSEGSTYKWDSCAPHAILRALGGGICDLSQCLSAVRNGNKDLRAELTYNNPHAGCQGAEQWANQGGLVAYLDSSVLSRVVEALADKI